MKGLRINVVIITDGERYIVHGCDDQTPPELFKAVTTLWEFDPSKESVHYTGLMVDIPEKESVPQVLFKAGVWENGYCINGEDAVTINKEVGGHPYDPRMDLTLDDCKQK
jgi:hypothetical protein